MADDRHPRVTFRLGLRGVERPAHRHRDAEQVEVVGGDDQRRHRHGSVAPLPVDLDFDLVAGDALERAVLVEVAPLGVGHVAPRLHLDVDELIRAGGGGLREQQRVGEAEYRGVGAHGDGDRKDGGQQQERLTHERPQRVAEVLRQVREERDAAHVAALFLDAPDRPERAQRRRAGFVRAHPGRDVLGGLLVHMEIDFRPQGPIEIRPARERPQAQPEPIDPPAHAELLSGPCPTASRYSASRTTSPIAVDNRSQASSSRASCFRPAAVNE